VIIRYLTDLEQIESILHNLRENDSIIISYKANVDPFIKNLHFWKIIGLLITDGQFKQTLREKKAVLNFTSLSFNTAIAVVKTLLQLDKDIVISIKVKLRKDMRRLMYIVRLLIRKSNRDIYNVRNKIFIYINELLRDPEFVLSNLDKNELCAFFSGLIDGDGHVGKAYTTISYDLKTLKGLLVHRILDYFHNHGFIRIYKYDPKKREMFFTFADYDFLYRCQKMIYHPRRRRKLEYYLINYSKNYVCGFSTEELKQLLITTKSAYIDYRKPPRTSRVLVLYIDKDDFNKVKHIWSTEKFRPRPIVNNNRIMIKLTAKCLEELSNIMKNIEFQKKLDPKIISCIKKYLNNI